MGGIDATDGSEFHLLAQRLITPEDLSRAKGHLYPLLLIRLALNWVTDAHTSYRGVALIFTSLQGVVAAAGPCAETIRLWLLRVGLFLLRRPMPRCSDWVFLLDLTIQLGQHKCLVILGIRLSGLRQNGYNPSHHDVHVLALHVLTRCSGKTVAKHLAAISKRVGVPAQIVSDHGSDVRRGIGLFRRKQRYPERIVETYDVTHGLAIVLKNQLEPDPRWGSFVKACQSTRQQLQQTAGSFLQPPAWRSKSRFLNLERHLIWANEMMALLHGGGEATLAEHLGRRETESTEWLEEKMGWLRGYGNEVRVWSYYQKVVKEAQEDIKREGLSRTSWLRIKNRLAGGKKLGAKEKEFRREVLSFVRKEGAKVPARQRYLGSTDVLESIFGKYKDLAEKAPCREITANVLMIPLLVTPLTAGILREGLETVRGDEVEQWLDEHLGASSQQKKQAVLSTCRETNADPESA